MNERGIEFQRIFGIIVMCILIVIYAISSPLTDLVDMQFFYNRVCQMRSCIEDGIFPHFYYNDFMGVGYGSSFFYGQLILVPFMFFTGLSESGFANLVVIIMFVLNFFGVARLAKRFTTNYYMIATLFIVTPYMTSCVLFANMLTLGLSWFFLAKCVDFFRDKKSFIPASVLFFVLMNSHLITSLLSFFCCILIMLYYFDKTRLVDYIKFAVFTGISCSYFLVNMIYHSSCISIRTDVMGTYSKKYLMYIPNIISYILGTEGSTDFENGILSGFFIVPILIFMFAKKFKSVNKRLILLFAVVIGVSLFITSSLWYTFDNITRFVQFPTRLYSYITVFVLIIIFRYANYKWVLFSLLIMVDSICVFRSYEGTVVNDLYYKYIVSGEYLSSDFVYNKDKFDYMRTHVTNNEGDELEFNVIKNKVSINIPEHNSDWTITIPKLYYEGYYCDKGFECYSGDSQFVSINIGTYSGNLSVYYRHPIWLVSLEILSDFTALVLFIIICLNNRIKCVRSP